MIKLIKKCKICKRKRFAYFVRKRTIHLTVGEATSKDEMCGSCYKAVETVINNSQNKHD